MNICQLLFSTSIMLSAFAATAWGAEPQWIFNGGEDFARFSIGQGTAREEFGLTAIESTGYDCTFGISLDEDEQFEAEKHPFFALRYKYNADVDTAGLFFTTDELPRLSDESFSMFGVKPDNTWRNVIVDMREFKHGNWKGTIKSFRLDPTNPSAQGSVFALSRMGFFATEEEARQFLTAADDLPDYERSTVISAEGFRCYVPGGSVNGDFDREAFNLQNPVKLGEFKLNGMREELVVVQNGKVIAFCDATSRGFMTYSVRQGGDLKIVDKALDANNNDFVGRKTEHAIRFVLARELMRTDNGKFRPEAKISKQEIDDFAKNALDYLNYGKIAEKFVALPDALEGLTREEAAVQMMNAIRSGLNTEVYQGQTREYYQRDRLRIGAWGNFRPMDFDDEYMAVYADCGFDFLLPFVAADTRTILNLANKYHIEVYVNDGGYANPLVGDAEYCDFPNYTGSYVTDEPGSDAYDKLAEKCNPYYRATGLEAYINLLPMYANAAQLKYGAGAAAIEYYDPDPDLFRKYCEAFCQKIEGKYICTDIYPFNWTGQHTKNTYSDYVESINIIASVAREYDREFWCYIQTFAWIPSKRTPNESEFRWQCYSMLSFGCKCILCWTYAGDDAFPSLVDGKSRKTPAWYAAKPVFWELRALSDEYIKYKNLGVFTHNCTEDTPYLRTSNEYKDFSTIKKIECEQPLLVGCFEKKENEEETAFTLVNMSEFEDVKSATVRVKINGSTVTSWRRGKPVKVMPDGDGFYTFELECGDGIFVTVK